MLSSQSVRIAACPCSVSKRQQSQGCGPEGRDPTDCRRFWTSVSRVKNVNNHRDVAILVIVVAFGPSCSCGVSKMSTITGMKPTRVAIHVTVVVFGSRTLVAFENFDSHRDPGGRGHKTQNYRHSWARLSSWRVNNFNSHQNWARSWLACH